MLRKRLCWEVAGVVPAKHAHRSLPGAGPARDWGRAVHISGAVWREWVVGVVVAVVNIFSRNFGGEGNFSAAEQRLGVSLGIGRLIEART